MKENQGRQKASPEATIEVTPTGSKVSSPGVGVIILVISLLFFYLYLVYVYPIEEILWAQSEYRAIDKQELRYVP